MNLKQAKTLMTQDEFWNIIAKSNKGKNLYKVLNELSDDKLLGCNYWQNYFYIIAHKQALWEVAYVVLQGCDNEFFFMDFKCWLIAQGQEVFENALKNADSLCGVFDGIKKGDMPLQEIFFVREIIDKRHGNGAFDKIMEGYYDLYPNYPEFNWNEEGDESCIRQICPKTFDKWWDSDKF